MKCMPTAQGFSKACKQYDKTPWKPSWYVSVTVTGGEPKCPICGFWDDAHKKVYGDPEHVL